MHMGSQDLKEKKKENYIQVCPPLSNWTAETYTEEAPECSVSQPCLTLQLHGPGSSVHGIVQARILEWVAISYARGSSQPRDQRLLCLLCWQVDSLPLHHLGSPYPEVTGQQHGDELNTRGSWQHDLWLQAIGNYLTVKALKRLVEHPFNGSTSAQLWNEWGISLWTDMKWFSGYTVKW